MRLSLKLLLVVLLAAVPALAVQIYLEWEARAQRQAEIADQVTRLAHLAAARQDQFVEGARYLLTAAAQLREVRELDAEACSARLVEFHRELPAITGIGAADPAGNVFCTSRPAAPPVNLADRDYVRRALTQRTMTVSGYIVGRETDAGTLNFAYPATGEDGQVRAVLVLAFGLDRLAESFADMTVPRDASMSLLDRHGILLARAPPAPHWVGQGVRQSGAWETPAAAASPFEAEGIDGVRRIYAVVPLRGTDELFISVGLPVERMLAAANRLFWQELALLGAVFLVAALAAWFAGTTGIRRPIRALERAAQRLAKGDLSARARTGGGAPEIAALAGSFDLMARSLQGRDRALRESERRFRDIAESASDWIWETDDQQRFTFFSARLAELTGADAKQWLGIRRTEILAEVVAPSDIEAHQADLAARRPFRNFTYWFETPRGRICASISGKPVFDPDGRFRGYRGTGTDVTEAKLAEAQRARLAAIVESSRDAIYTWTVDGTISSWNAEAERLFGYSAAEAIGRTIYLHMPPDRAALTAANIERIRQGQSLEQIETVRIRKDGTPIDISMTVSPIKDASGRVVAASTIARDITQRKRAETALRESQERFKDIAEATSDWIWETDQDLRFTYVSDRVTDVSGRPRGFYLGRTVAEVMNGRAPPEDLARHLADLRARRPFRNTIFWANRPSGRRCYSLSGTPRFDAAGRFLGYRGVGTDITERHLADERQRLMMAELDHRVKNILATVQSIAVQTLPSDGAAETLLGRINALAHAHSMLSQNRWEGARLHALLDEELAPYRTGTADRVKISGSDVVLTPRSAQLLAIVLHELATNAGKYGALSTPQGRVEVSWRLAKGPAGRRLMMSWIERGGPPAITPSRRGFGTTLIERSLAYELDGMARLDFLPEGVRCEIDVPLDRRTAPRPGERRTRTG